MTSLFDQATALSVVDENRFRTEIDDEWSIAGVPNGGLLMSIAVTAGLHVSGAADPVTMTTHFLSPTQPGVMEVVVDSVKSGRTFSTVVVRTTQDERERTRTLLTVGDLTQASGPTMVSVAPPLIDDQCVVLKAERRGFVNVTSQFEYRIPPAMAWGSEHPTGVPRVSAQIRFAGGRPPDLQSAPLMLDALPPTTFQLGTLGWSPTIEMTVHFRQRPTPGWCTVALTADTIVNGMFSEDGILWDESGAVVAVSRQLAMTAS